MDIGNSSQPLNPNEPPTFILVVNVLVGITSGLSLVGGTLIPATWLVGICSPKNPRNPPPESSPARIILCFLGIADALVALSHLSGIIAGYDKYSMNNVTDEISNSGTQVFCVIQGSLAVYSTVASFLWTIILSLFVSATVLLPRPRWFGGCCAMTVYIVIGWGIPAAVFATLFAMKDYGYEPDVSLSWCFSKSRGSPQPQRDIINLLSYDLWGALTLLILGTLIVVTCVYVIRKKKTSKTMDTSPLRNGINQNKDQLHEDVPLLHNRQESAKTSDFKLGFAAIILIVLRVWDLPFLILRYDASAAKQFESTCWAELLIVLEEVGDSFQGLANAFLFLFCVKDYREWIWNGLKNRCSCQHKPTELT